MHEIQQSIIKLTTALLLSNIIIVSFSFTKATLTEQILSIIIVALDLILGWMLYIKTGQQINQLMGKPL